MDVEILNTDRCLLRPITINDAGWLYHLFNDMDVVKYIEGITLFNADIHAVRQFIDSMRINAQNNIGAIWSVEYRSNNIGFIMAYDLTDNPFLTYALFPKYRGLGIMSECIDAICKHVYAQSKNVPFIKVIKTNIAGLKMKKQIDNQSKINRYN